VIENCTPGSKVPQLAVSSTAEEWEKSGRTLFRSKRYFQAMHCFERAGMHRETAVANAYLKRENARLMPSGTKGQDAERIRAFAEAAKCFRECAEAGGEKAYYRLAGECYARAENDYQAGTAFRVAELYDLSARHYRKGEHFDEAVDVVQSHPVEASFKEKLIDVAKFYYISSGDPDKVRKATPLFNHDIKAQLEYMEEADLDIARATLLANEGRFAEAADVHFIEGKLYPQMYGCDSLQCKGRPMQALKLLLNDQEHQSSLLVAKDRLLEHLWYHLSFGITLDPVCPDTDLEDFLRMARDLDRSKLNAQDSNEVGPLFFWHLVTT
jgi:tetratricopeptide (TPR) repeat protein